MQEANFNLIIIFKMSNSFLFLVKEFLKDFPKKYKVAKSIFKLVDLYCSVLMVKTLLSDASHPLFIYIFVQIVFVSFGSRFLEFLTHMISSCAAATW